MSEGLGHQDNRMIEFGLAILAPRWTSLVLIELAGGRKRTTQLLKNLPGLSAKTLCERLRKLQDLGLVTRTTYPEVPPRVEYELTDAGREILEVLRVLKRLGGHWISIEMSTAAKGKALGRQAIHGHVGKAV